MNNKYNDLKINTKVINKEELTIFVEVKINDSWTFYKTYPIKLNKTKYNSYMFYFDKLNKKMPMFYYELYWYISDDLEPFFKKTELPDDSFYFSKSNKYYSNEFYLSWTTLDKLNSHPWNKNINLINTDDNHTIEVPLKIVFSYMYLILKVINEDIEKIKKNSKIDEVRLILY